jgi:hypothetical protein
MGHQGAARRAARLVGGRSGTRGGARARRA